MSSLSNQNVTNRRVFKSLGVYEFIYEIGYKLVSFIKKSHNLTNSKILVVSLKI